MYYLKNLNEKNLLIGVISTDSLRITNFEVTKNCTKCKVYYNDVFLIDFEREEELTSVDVIKVISEEFSYELRNYAGDNVSKMIVIEGGFIDSRKKESDELEELVSEAQPMKARRDMRTVLHKQGFVRGVVVKISEGRGYRVFTGQFGDSEGDTVNLLMTDGHSFHSSYCSLVDDVNKDILRTVSAEKMRIMEVAENFCHTIDSKLNSIIYGEG